MWRAAKEPICLPGLRIELRSWDGRHGMVQAKLDHQYETHVLTVKLSGLYKCGACGYPYWVVAEPVFYNYILFHYSPSKNRLAYTDG